MSIDRRDFVGRLATGALLAGVPFPIDASVRALSQIPAEPSEEWDISWVKRVTGKYRAVFDVPEIDSGYGVWRASIWARQYQEVLGAKPNELSAVVVLRHNGIQLAMQQAYWDKYGIGKEKNVMHPVTQQGTDRNPALLASSRGEVPAMFDDAALDRFISRGGGGGGGGASRPAAGGSRSRVTSRSRTWWRRSRKRRTAARMTHGSRRSPFSSRESYCNPPASSPRCTRRM